MLPYRDSKVTQIALVVFFLIVLGYGYFEARGLIFGPQINISSQTTTVSDPYVMIQGSASYIASLSVDGEQIPVTQAGAFQEPYLLAPGVNRIVFDAVDTYGRKREKVVEIVYIPAATSSPDEATSTLPTAPTAASSSAPIAPAQ